MKRLGLGWRHVITLMLALAMVAAACSGSTEIQSTPADGDGTADDGGTEGGSTDDGTDDTVSSDDGPTDDGGETPTPTAAAEDAAAIAAAWLNSEAAMGDRMMTELQQSEIVSAGPVTHVTFDQVIDGRRVRGSEITVHVLADGSVQGASESLIDAQPNGAAATVDEAAAVSVASKAVEGTVEGSTQAEAIWFHLGASLTPAWLISLSTREPVGSWTIVVDATNSGVLATDRGGVTFVGHAALNVPWMGATIPSVRVQTGDACAVPTAPSACVYPINPYAAAGGPVDPGSGNQFLVPVTLEGLTQSDQLVGQYVDTAPAGAPVIQDPEADGTWAGGVGSRNFEAAMSYFWLDRTQRIMQSLGFQIRSDEPTRISPLVPDAVDNAFFDGNTNEILMGVGSNGIHAAQDATVLIHEYGHAILDTQVGTDTHYSSHEIGAYSEGFGDILAALTTVEFRIGDPACISGWFGLTNGCFRRVDTSKVYPDDLTFAVHDDGELFAGAVWDIFEGLLALEGLTTADCGGTAVCNEVRDRMLTIVLGSHYYIAPRATLVDIANNYLLANEATFGDADRDVLEQAFFAHGLLGQTTTSMDPNGGGNDPAATAGVGIDIVHDYRGDLFLSVGVVDADYNALCDEIVLLEPNAEDNDDNVFGIVDISGTPCSNFLPPGPDQLWYLFAADDLAEDEGNILEFIVFDGDNPYPAGGLPLLIPDGDPEGTFALVDGTGVAVPEEGQSEPGGSTDGEPFITVDITHTYSGDLSIRGGVADAEGTIICSVPIYDPDPADNSPGLAGDVNMGECASLYPPTPDRQWFLQVIDTADKDVGTIDQYSLTGPDGELFEFLDLPLDIADNDEDGIALLLDGTGGSNGEAGGSGQGSSLELPAVSVAFNHPFTGDLAVAAGVVDSNFNVLCEVPLLTPDPNDESDNPSGDVSLSECAEFYPPTPSQQWYLFARDTLAQDEGTLEQFTLTGPDGQVFDFADVGQVIPDANQDGLAVFINGSESMSAGSGETSVGYIISHTYVGDLYVEIGVLDSAGNALCGLVVTEEDPDNSTVDLAGVADLSECESLYPPSPDQIWYLYAEDTAAFDEGTIDVFIIEGPDGEVWDASNVLPVVIPDASVDGALITFDGT